MQIVFNQSNTMQIREAEFVCDMVDSQMSHHEFAWGHIVSEKFLIEYLIDFLHNLIYFITLIYSL